MKKNKKKVLPIPNFKNEDEERRFWETHNVVDYFDTSKEVFFDLSELKSSTRPITIRLTESLLGSLKILANKHDVPYQSLMKIYLADRVKQEFGIKST